ncbi:MAG: sulfur reduction protein DsrE [Methanomassiliicoccales archaeon]
MEESLIISTHAEDNAEKAILPFVIAVAALASEMQPTIALQSMGVYIATKGHAKLVHESSFPPLENLLQSFTGGGGRLMVCSPLYEKEGD